ncbi:MAG: DUF2157 domain-containing protein [Hoeflea sp.]|uniref:DUF2157 domain-containing protein n=1 Tax=Hoeflea sp. TaxID=1940281 RepID=UPI0032EB85B4
MLRKYIVREIGHWSKGGLLSPGQGERLLADYDARHTGFNLSAVLAVLAAVLFGAAVIALVASNWEIIARPLRVLLIAFLISVSLVVAVISKRRNAQWIMEASLVTGILSYGAGLALISQMYHISGDQTGFMLTWATASLVVALAFSSGLSAIAAGLLGLGLLWAQIDMLGIGPANTGDMRAITITLLVALITAIAALRSRSIVAGHLVVILIICWLVWVGDNLAGIEPKMVLPVLGVAALALGWLPPAGLGGFVERHGWATSYGAFLLLLGLAIMQLNLSNPSLLAEMAMAAVILLASVVLLVMSGAHNALVRRLAYFAFAAETLCVVSETLGSLIGSSGFLFVGGLVLAIIAFAVMKIEKRIRAGGELS